MKIAFKWPITLKFFFLVSFISLNFFNLAQAKVIDLNDTETLGSIVIDATAIQKVSTKPYGLFINDKGAQTHKVYRLPAGKTHTLSLKYDNFTSQMKFMLKPEETKTIKLSALKLQWDQSLLNVDIGPQPFIQISNDFLTHDFLKKSWSNFLNPPQFPSFGEKEPEPTNYEYLVVFPGKYKLLSPGLNIPPATVTIKENAVRSFTYSFKDPRSTLILNPPQKHLKDMFSLEEKNEHIYLIFRGTTADSSPLIFKNNYRMPFSMVSCLSCWGPPSKDYVHLHSNTEAKYIPYFNAQYIHLELVINNTWLTLPFSTNAQQHTLNIARIDLNDILINQEDGQEYRARGRYDLYIKNHSAQTSDEHWLYVQPIKFLNHHLDGSTVAVSEGNFITGHGLSVVPGEYKLDVKYETGEGEKTQEYITDLR